MATQSKQQVADPLGPFLREAITSIVQELLQGSTVQKRLFTVEEAAVYLGRSVNAIRELERSGKLRAVRSDGRVMFDIHDLDALIEEGKN